MSGIALHSPPMMTADDCRAWPGDGTGAGYQLADGVARAMAQLTDTHGTIQTNVAGATQR